MDKFISRIGTDLGIGGFILSNGNETYLIPLPEEYDNIEYFCRCYFNDTELEYENILDNFLVDTRNGVFEAIIKQSDEVLVECIRDNEKIILRKNQRQLDAAIQWQVFKRDGYACRYCGKDNVPLTVDHVMTWEVGGPYTKENLVASCRKCNKTRGNMPYEQWLQSPYYMNVSKNLTEAQKNFNGALTDDLKNGIIVPLKSKRGR